MRISARKMIFGSVALVAVLATAMAAAPDVQLKMPNFDSLAAKASDSVSITLDSALLGIAAGFLDSSKPEDAAAKELIGGLKGIYVKSYTFDKDFAYPTADVDLVRKQCRRRYGNAWLASAVTRNRLTSTSICPWTRATPMVL